MQALSLPRRKLPTPHHQHNSTISLPQPDDTHPTILVNKFDDKQVSPAKKLTTRTQTTKPKTTTHLNYTTTAALLAPKTHKQCPVLDHRQLKARLANARRRATQKDKLQSTTKQHPLSDYWSDITPQSLPVALHPTKPTKKNALTTSTP